MPAWTPASDPGLFPLELSADHGRLRMVRLAEEDYATASFLDGRLLAAAPPSEWASTAEVLSASPPPRAAHLIFHIGHCGSTLLSRLLGEHPALFVLREPALLRAAAAGELSPEEERALVGLYTRVWRPGQTAVIKATSVVSEIGLRLMDLTPGRAILLAVTPPVYLRTILGGPNSRRETARMAADRQARLERRLGRPLQVSAEGETVALSWLCEAFALHALAVARPAAVLRLDFEAVLREPAAWLAACLSHFGADAGAMDLAALVAGPVMSRYAKGPEHAYDAGLRAAVLAQAAHEAPGEIRSGMDWLQREAQADPRVAAVLRDAAETARRRPLAPPPPAG